MQRLVDCMLFFTKIFAVLVKYHNDVTTFTALVTSVPKKPKKIAAIFSVSLCLSGADVCEE